MARTATTSSRRPQKNASRCWRSKWACGVTFGLTSLCIFLPVRVAVALWLSCEIVEELRRAPSCTTIPAI